MARIPSVWKRTALLAAWFAAGGLLGTAAPRAAGQNPDPKTVGRQPENKPAANAGRRWAFLVGVNDYTKQPKLKYCRQDVLALRDALVKRCRFEPGNIVTLTDDAKNDRDRPTYGQIYDRLPQVLEVAEPEDLVFVYLSGHGAQFEDNKGKQGYFVPLDGGGRQTSIPLAWVTEQLEACKARQKVLVLDACRNDVAEGNKATRSLENSVVADSQGKSFVTLFSCDAGQKSSEHDQASNGVFTHFLLEGLNGPADENKDGRIDLYELHQYARAKTRQWGVQHAQPQAPILKGEIADPITLAFVAANPPVVATSPPPDRTPPERIRPPQPPAPVAGNKTLTLDLGGGVTLELARIEAGEFLMGSPESEAGQKSGEGPQHRVTISRPFYMGKYEVTQKQWRAVMGNNPSQFQGDDLPMEQVSWDDCQEFCRRLSQKVGQTVRLPTEAEWEYACRAGTTTRFSFGDSETMLGEYAWFHGNSGSQTHPVGQKKPNAWGLYDMHGNVWEWCQDWYINKYSSGDQVDPTGPGSGFGRVLRGGSWNHLPQNCRAADRNWNAPQYHSHNNGLGFRVAVVGTP